MALKYFRWKLAGCVMLLAATAVAAAQSADVMQEWRQIKAPAPPMLSGATIAPDKAALLLITFDKRVCSAMERARCPAAIPKVKRLLEAARAKHMLVVHGFTTNQTAADIVPELAPAAGEPIVRAPADKFLGSGLEELLKTRDIATVIVTGTAGNGAVLFTVIGGATLGFNLVVPVDAIPADSAYHEQFAITEMADIGFIKARTTLTTSDMIVFQGEPQPRAVELPAVLQEWANISPPAAPALAPIAVDASKSALLVMDFNKAVCTPEMRPRCAAAVPNVRKLVDAARAKNMLVVHVITPNMKTSDVVDALAPRTGEPVLQVQGDKFYRSDLEKLLREKGISTVIATGTSGNGAVLLTTIGGVSRGFNMIVPVDTMPSATPYHEQFSIFEIADVNFLHAHAALTRSDMIRIN